MSEQKELLDLTAVAVRPRPRPTASDVAAVVLAELSANVAGWLSDRNGDMPNEEIIADLTTAYMDTGSWDGVKMCLALVNHCDWFGLDMKLVNILEWGWSIEHNELVKATAGWVVEQGMKAIYKGGDKVMWEGHHAEVLWVADRSANYRLLIPTMGHVWPSKHWHGKDGIFVPFEQLHEAMNEG